MEELDKLRFKKSKLNNADYDRSIENGLQIKTKTFAIPYNQGISDAKKICKNLLKQQEEKHIKEKIEILENIPRLCLDQKGYAEQAEYRFDKIKELENQLKLLQEQ